MELKDRHSRQKREYKVNLATWQTARDEFEAQRELQHKGVEEKKRAYHERDADAIVEYCENVLLSSNYPDFCPRFFLCGYVLESKTLIVEYRLPWIDDIPSRKAAKYDKTQGRISLHHHLASRAEQVVRGRELPNRAQNAP